MPKKTSQQTAKAQQDGVLPNMPRTTYIPANEDVPIIDRWGGCLLVPDDDLAAQEFARSAGYIPIEFDDPRHLEASIRALEMDQ